MNGYYYLVNRLKTYLDATGFVNSVSIGDIYEVDLKKQTMFPLSHIIVNNATPSEQVLSFNISILFMDIVDDSKSEITNLFEGNDNTHDVLNTQCSIANRLYVDLIRGNLYSELVQVDGTPSPVSYTHLRAHETG
jgi:hypothetical protein